MERKPFTVEKGIEVQTRHLDDWKRKLKPELYEALRIHAVKDNFKANSGYDICRGTDLDNFIHNY